MLVRKKRITCRVCDGRVRFVCPTCRKRQIILVRPSEKIRTITCKGCKQKSVCIFNRRSTVRESQSGNARLMVQEGEIIPVQFHDISQKGVGFIVPAGRGRRFYVGQSLLNISCDWTSRFSLHKLVIRNISGDKIGCAFC